MADLNSIKLFRSSTPYHQQKDQPCPLHQEQWNQVIIFFSNLQQITRFDVWKQLLSLQIKNVFKYANVNEI